jgi:hypothetical protein
MAPVPLLVLLSLGCEHQDLSCGPGTVQHGDECWPEHGDADTDADGDTDTDTDTDADTDADTDTDTGIADLPALVYLLGGQSNMVGVGQASALPPSLRVAQDDVWIYWSGWPAWRGLQPSSDYSSGSGSYMGPEVSFGRAMADAHPGREVYLIKHAVGGTDLASYWYPGTEDSDPSMGEGYRVWLDTVHGGLAELEDQGVDYEVAGMIWMQGEADASVESWAHAYQDNLLSFIDRVREDVGVDDMPFSLGLIDCDGLVAWRETVRTAQQAVADGSPLVHAFETEDLGAYPYDACHYQGLGQRVMGERFAATLLGEQPPPLPEPAVEITGNYQYHYYGNYTVGYRFELRAPVLLTDLGIFDLGIDGLAHSAEIALWDTVSQSLLLSASMPAWDVADSSWYSGFRWVGIEPTTLPPGDYIVVNQAFYYNFDYYVFGAEIQTADAVRFVEGRHGDGTGLVFPPNVSEADEHYALWFGANLMFREAEQGW